MTSWPPKSCFNCKKRKNVVITHWKPAPSGTGRRNIATCDPCLTLGLLAGTFTTGPSWEDWEPIAWWEPVGKNLEPKRNRDMLCYKRYGRRV